MTLYCIGARIKERGRYKGRRLLFLFGDALIRIHRRRKPTRIIRKIKWESVGLDPKTGKGTVAGTVIESENAHIGPSGGPDFHPTDYRRPWKVGEITRETGKGDR